MIKVFTLNCIRSIDACPFGWRSRQAFAKERKDRAPTFSNQKEKSKI